jgi:hypothetical protein
MNRRQFLASVGTAFTVSAAGCGSDSSANSPTSDTVERTEISETPTEPPEISTDVKSATPVSETTVLVDDTITLPEGENLFADFSVSSPVTVEYEFSVQEDIEIDFFVLSLSNFRQYRSGQSFTAIQSVDDSEAMDSVRISRGNYYIVLDHSSRGPTSPPGQFEKVSATVNATISYSS